MIGMAKLIPRLINGIRCFSASHKYDKFATFGSFDDTFPSRLAVQNIAERYFLKLRELDFHLPGFTEVHIQFYPDEDMGPKHSTSDGVHLWNRQVYVGLDLSLWLDLNQVEQEVQMIELIGQACQLVSASDQSDKIDTAKLELLNRGQSLSIKIFEKEVSSYSVRIVCQVPSILGPVTSQVIYEDRKTQQTFQAEFVDALYVPDLIHLCGIVIVKSGILTISPRKNDFASSISWKYGGPKRFTVSKMERIEL
ncbi:hypothetical protein GCM10011309_04100 [Litorimonas cladophorae]|uniref:Uncharacterized protein n=2 Tax=Litorimonas cladophorae TaxID=1220491 RepID=A0A918NAC1_9PROT|nr:hypothetical protein GCM10011309_04100 [Litorimonas cladophorae]